MYVKTNVSYKIPKLSNELLDITLYDKKDVSFKQNSTN